MVKNEYSDDLTRLQTFSPAFNSGQLPDYENAEIFLDNMIY